MYGNSHFSQNLQYGNNISQTSSSTCNYVQTYEPSFTYPAYGYDTHVNNASTLVIASNQRQKDAEFFENFINENKDVTELKSKGKCKRLGISETRVLLASIKKLTTELKDSILALENNKELSELEWKEKIQKCQATKVEIEKLSGMLQDAEKICNFKTLVEKRKRKRQRMKRLRAKWQASKVADAERRARLHTAIDTWIREKQEVIEQEKQEDNQRKNADMVLADIRGKRSDARKYLGLLHELENLRKVKANNASARGEHLSAAANQTFDRVIVQLIEHWSELDHQYSIEERRLKLMLKTDNDRIMANQKKNSFDDWEIAIFGRKLQSVDTIQTDLNGFVMTRIAWDKYISYDSEGSRIPIGWIMPEPSSSAAWQKCLKNE